MQANKTFKNISICQQNISSRHHDSLPSQATPHGDAGDTAMIKRSGTRWVGIEFDRSLV